MYYIIASYYIKGLIVKSSTQLTISKSRLGHRKGIKEKGKRKKQQKGGTTIVVKGKGQTT